METKLSAEEKERLLLRAEERKALLLEEEKRSLERLDRTIEGIILEATICTELEKMWRKK